MIKVEQSYLLPMPIEVVFAYISDARNELHWQSSCKKVETVSPSNTGVGTRYRIYFEFLGREMEFEVEVTALVVPHHYAYNTLSGPMYYEGEYRFTPIGNGTQIDWTFAAEPGGFFGILPRTLLKKVLSKQVETDIGRLRQILGAQHAVTNRGSALASG